MLYRKVPLFFASLFFNCLIAQKISNWHNYFKKSVEFYFLTCYNSFWKLGNIPEQLRERQYCLSQLNKKSYFEKYEKLKSENPKGKKKSLAELMKSIRSQLTNKITERDEDFSKQAIIAELDALKAYISEIA